MDARDRNLRSVALLMKTLFTILTILEHWLTVWPPTTLQYAYKNVIAKFVKTYEVKKNQRSVLV